MSKNFLHLLETLFKSRFRVSMEQPTLARGGARSALPGGHFQTGLRTARGAGSRDAQFRGPSGS